MNDHHEEEQLDRPHVDAVEEVPHPGVVPPGGALQGEDRSRGDDHDQRGDARHAEHVDPGGDICRLTVRKQLLRGQGGNAGFADAYGPGARSRRRGAHEASPRLCSAPGNGSRMASANTTSIRPITTTLATDMWMKFQSTVWAGWFRLKTAPITFAPTSPTTDLLLWLRLLGAG